ncbi:MAG: loricrin-like protein [Patescibacteria group bacterium]|nr:loricrin-like protein [Patescibacteria group bacterium]
MSVFTQFLPGRIRKQQIFTSSGTFTPSARLLALGGWVEVLCVGGGGGGYTDGGNVKTGGGGGAVVRRIVQVTGPVTVTIGAGGTGGTNPTSGGTTSFGSLVSAPGGSAGNNAFGGTSGNGIPSGCAGGSGAGGPAPIVGLYSGGYYTVWGSWHVSPGGPGLYGYGRGGAGTSNNSQYGLNPFSGPPNSGSGGSVGEAGASGICIVEWFE